MNQEILNICNHRISCIKEAKEKIRKDIIATDDKENTKIFLVFAETLDVFLEDFYRIKGSLE